MLRNLIEHLTRKRFGPRRKRHSQLRRIAFHRGMSRGLQVESLEHRVVLASAVLDAAGVLTVSNNGTETNDFVLALASGGTDLLVTDNNNSISGDVRVALADVTNIIVNAHGGDDNLTVDFSGGNMIPAGGLTYNAGTQDSAVGDSLVILGTPTGVPLHTTTTTFVDSDANGFNLTIELDPDGTGESSTRIIANGIEPLTNLGTATNIIFNLPSVANPDATLQNSVNPGEMELVGSTFENTIFSNPLAGGSLTINHGGPNADSIFVAGVDATFNADLTINADSNDTVRFQNNPTNIGNGNLMVLANRVDVNASVTTAGSIDLTSLDFAGTGDDLTVATGAALQSTGGNVTLRAGDNVNIQTGSTVNAAGILTIEGDFGNADTGTGSTIDINGTIVSAAAPAMVMGGADNDTVTLDPDSVTGSVMIDPADGDDNVQVANTTISGTAGTGLHITNAETLGISNSIFNGNATHGIELSDVGTVDLANVMAGNNAEDGLRLRNITSLQYFQLTEVLAMTHLTGSDLLFADRDRNLGVRTTSGLTTIVGQLDHDSKGLTYDGLDLLSVSTGNDQLRTIDASDAATLSSVTITLAGATVQGATGLATDPISGDIFGLLKLQGQFSRQLVSIDPATGVATSIGDTGDRFSSLAFDAAGILYGVTGDGANVPETLFTLDTTTAAATQVLTLGKGDNGEALAFNPNDGLFYHASGFFDVVFESIDLTGPTFQNIPLSADVGPGHDVTISNSSFSGNVLIGVGIAEVGDLSLTNVTADGNQGGLDVLTLGSLTIDGGSYSANRLANIFTFAITGVARFTNVTVDGSTGSDGIIMTFGAGALAVTGGSFSGNDGFGLLLDTFPNGVTMDGVTVDNNGGAGFDVVNAGRVNVLGGSYSGNTFSGINLFAVGETTIENIASTGNVDNSMIQRAASLALFATTGAVADTVSITDSTIDHSRGPTVQNTIDYADVPLLVVSTGDGEDTINVAPSQNTAMQIFGGSPTAPASPGDVLNFMVPAAENSSIANRTIDSGTIQTTGGFLDVVYDEIEMVTGAVGDTLVINLGPDDDLLVLTATGPNSANIDITLDVDGSNGGPFIIGTIMVDSIDEFILNGGGSADRFQIRHPAGGLFAVPAGIKINGGDPTAGPGDILELFGGGTVTTITHVFANSSDGIIDWDGSTLIYTGLEPINDNMNAINRVFQFTDPTLGGETITLADDAGLQANVSEIDSTAGEIVTFINPIASLTIQTAAGGGTGADTVNIEGLDGNFDAHLNIIGDGDDTINFQTNDTDIGSGNLMATANTINFSASATTTGAVILNAGTGGINDTSAGPGSKIAAASLDATARNATDGGNIGSGANPLEVIVASLTTNTSGGNSSGSQWINDFVGLTALDLNAGTGNVFLSVAQAVTDTDADVDITASSANVDVEGANFGSATNSIGTNVNSLTVDTTGIIADGSQWIDEADGLFDLDLNAGAGNIFLNAAGPITDGFGDTITDITAAAASVTIGGAGGNFGATGGTDQEIDTNVGTLSIDTSANNNTQWIDELNGLVIGTLNAGTGMICLDAGGSITSATVDGVADVIAGTIDIHVMGAGFTIGANAANPLEINGATLEAITNRAVGDDIFLRETDTIEMTLVNAGLATINLTGGRFNANGTVTATTVNVNAGTLGGTGVVTGAVNANNGSTLAPGLSPGVITTGDLTFLAGSNYDVEIGGTTPGNGAGFHDQIVVNGTVTIDMAATLTISAFMGFAASPGDQFVIIDNDGIDAVAGAFLGLPDNSAIDFGNQVLTISYDFDSATGTDGAGNDVALLAIGAAETRVSIDAAGNLVVTDINGGISDDSLTIHSDTTNNQFIIRDPLLALTTTIPTALRPDGNTVIVPFADVTGRNIIVDALGGDDTLTVDFSSGDFVRAITFNGGGQSSIGDSLVLTGGGTFAAVTHSFDNDNDGSVDITGNQIITYAGLEPVTDNLDVNNRVFRFLDATAGGEIITLSDAGGLAGFSQIDSTAGESVTFTNPAVSLTIQTAALGGAGTDTVNVEGVDALFDADLTIETDCDDTVNFRNAGLDIGSGTLTITTDTITISHTISTTGSVDISACGNINFTATGNIQASGPGAVTVTADNDLNGAGVLLMADGAVIDGGTGTITLTALGIVLGRVVTANDTASAIAITTTLAPLTDAGDTGGEDIEATAPSAIVTIATGQNVGARNDQIETKIGTLDLSVTGSGGVFIVETDAIVLRDVRTNDGQIVITANGTITATDVDSSITDDGSNEIFLRTTSGDVLVGLINAGTNNDIGISSAGAIEESGADAAPDLVGRDIAIVAGSGIGNAAQLEIDGINLGAVTQTGDINLLDTAGGLAIASAQAIPTTVSVVVISSGSAGDDITIRASSPLTVNTTVTNGGGGDITLAAEGNTGDADLSINANVTATGGSGNINLYAGDAIDIDAAVTISTTGTGTILASASTDFAGGAPTNGFLPAAAGDGDVVMNSGSTIAAGGNATIRGAGDIDLSLVIGDTVVVTADFAGVGGGLSDGTGEITDNRAGEAANVTASVGIAFRAGSGIGDANDINTATSLLAASNSTAGNIQIRNNGPLTVGTVAGLSGIIGGVSISAPGTITVDEPIAATGAAAVSLSARGANTFNVEVNNTISTEDGNITLDADQHVNGIAAADITTNSGIVSLSASLGPSFFGGRLQYSGDIAYNVGELRTFGFQNSFINGVISGSGQYRKGGDVQLQLQAANTYTGDTLIVDGFVIAENDNALGAASAGTVVQNNTSLILENVTVAEPVTLNGAGHPGLFGASFQLRDGALHTGPITLATDSRILFARSSEIAGPIGESGGSRALTIEAVGGALSQAVLSSNNHTYTGATTLTGDGTLFVTGSTPAASTFTVEPTATLGGTGTIGGPLRVQGTVAPGLSPGVITTGNLTFLADSNYDAEIGGVTPGNGAGFHDQIVVNGTVTIDMAAMLRISLFDDGTGAAFVPTAGGQFVIIDNDGTDAVNGTFAGLPDGAVFELGNQVFTISYDFDSATGTDGTGNDVALFAFGAAETDVSIDVSSGNLVITDISGGFSNDNLTIQSDMAGGRYIISDPLLALTTTIPTAFRADGNTVIVPFADVTGGTIIVDTLAGDDVLTVDFSLGTFSKLLDFRGGDPIVMPGDALRLVGGVFDTVVHSMTGPGSGNLDLDNDALLDITYTGLEPVDMTGSTATNLVFTLPLNVTDARLEDFGTAMDGLSQLRSVSAAFEATIFANPSGSLTINAAGGSTIELRAMDDGFNPGAMNFNGSGAANTFVVNSPNAVPDLSALSVNDTAVFNLNNLNETIGSLAGNGNVTLGNGTLTTGENDDSTTFSGSLGSGSGGLTKVGAGAFTLSGMNTYAGATIVANGTLRLDAENALPTTTALTVGVGASTGTFDMATFSQTVGSLTVNSNSAASNMIAIGTGQTLLVNGPFTVGRSGVAQETNLAVTGGGTLHVDAPTATINIGLANSDMNGIGNMVTVDMSALASFVANVTSFQVGFGSRIGAALILPDTSNSITATTVSVGDSGTSNAEFAMMTLGAGTNTINADSIEAGLGKGRGTIAFASQAAGSPGTVTVRGKTGGTSAANITLGQNTVVSTSTTPTGILDLRGHAADVVAGTLTMAMRNQSGGDLPTRGGVTGILHFDAGTFTVDTVDMANLSNATPGTAPATAELNVGGGMFTVNAGGTFRLAMNSGNSAANGTLSITGGVFNSNVDITDGGGVSTSTITLDGGTLDKRNQSIGGVTPVDTFNFRGGTLQNVAEINAGNGTLTKTTGAAATIAGTNTYTVPTVINGGTLMLSDASANNIASSPILDVQAGAMLDVTALGSSQLDLANGQTLQGDGAVSGQVRVSDGAAIAPGGTAGVLSSDSVTFDLGSTFTVELGGDVPGVGAAFHDQLKVTGAVTINDAALAASLFGGFVPSVGDSFVIIDNDNADAVTGMFAGLPDDSIFDIGDQVFSISYKFDSVTGTDGAGNDVTLFALGTAETEISIDAAGDLVITDINGGNSKDSLTIRADTVNNQYIISDPLQVLTSTIPTALRPDGHTVIVPFAAVTGNAIIVDALGGDDVLTVDFSAGNFDDAVFFNGGAQTGSPGDMLRLTGGTFDTVTHSFTNANDGTIDITGNQTITYTGLEPINDNLNATNRVFQFTGDSETITLENVELVSGSVTIRDLATSMPATTATLFQDLAGINGAAFSNGDVIAITGSDADGNAVNGTFTVNDITMDTLGDLLATIDVLFAGGVGATPTVSAAGEIELLAVGNADPGLALALAAQVTNPGNIDPAPFGTFVAAIANESRIDSTLGESVIFAAPTGSLPRGSLTIDVTGGTGADTIIIQGLDANFDADLNILGHAGGGAGFDDTVNFQTNALDVGTGNINVDAQTVNIGVNLTSAGGDITIRGTTVLKGNVTITAIGGGDFDGTDTFITSDAAGPWTLRIITGNSTMGAAVGNALLSQVGDFDGAGPAFTGVSTLTIRALAELANDDGFLIFERASAGDVLIQLDDASMRFEGRGVVIRDNTTIDTNPDNLGASGGVNLREGSAFFDTLDNIFGDGDGLANLTFEINTSSTDNTGGAIGIGLIDIGSVSGGGFANREHLAAVTLNASGITNASDGTIILGLSPANGLAGILVHGTGTAVTIDGTVLITADAIIDTNQGTGQAGGSVDLANARISGSIAGVDLTIDSGTGDGQSAGNIHLGDVDGAIRLQSFTAKLVSATGTDGTLTIADDDDATTDTMINVTGGNVDFSAAPTVVLGDNVVIDTNGGNVLFRGDGTISASASGVESLTIDTSSDNIGGPHGTLPNGLSIIGGAEGGGTELDFLTVTTGPLTISQSITTINDINVNVLDTAATTDNLTIDGANAPLVNTVRGDIVFNVGDDFELRATATLRANEDGSAVPNDGTVTINVDPSPGDADPGIGATLTISGTIETDAVVLLNGGDDDDTFNLQTANAPSLTIDGNAGSNSARIAGAGPGVLASGNITFLNTAVEFDLGGTTPGAGAGFHDQLDVVGTVTIGGNVTLVTTAFDGGTGPDFVPADGDQFVIINNDGLADAVTGTFVGLPEGALLSNNFLGSGLNAYLTYAGGMDNNDVVILINGSPTISGTVMGQMVDDNTTIMPFSGVTITDASPALTVTVTLSDGDDNGLLTNLGAFTKTGPGTYQLTGATAAIATAAIRTLVFDPTENQLPPGQMITTTFTIEADDGINPAASDNRTTVKTTSINDPPTIDGATNPASIAESVGDSSAQDIPQVDGTITITDQDLGDTLTVSVTGNATASYTPNGGTAGAVPAEDSVTLTSLIASGAISFDALTSDGEQQTINWHYDPAATDLDWLRAGDVLVLTYVAQVDDGAGNVGAQDLVITITGTNDQPDITAGDAVMLMEAAEAAVDDPTLNAGDLMANGSLAFNDVDDTDTFTAAVTGLTATGASGVFAATDDPTLLPLMTSPNGGAVTEAAGIPWSFTGSEALFDYLGTGQSLVLTYTLEVTDNGGLTDADRVVITINGKNDAPDIAAGDAVMLMEAAEVDVDDPAQNAGDLMADGSLAFNDVDDTDTFTAAVTGLTATGASGVFAVTDDATLLPLMSSPNGGAVTEAAGIPWSFTGSEALFDYLGDTQSLVLTYTLQVTDNGGLTDIDTVVITINGKNDPPTPNPEKVTTTENAPVTVDVLANDTDVDGDDSPANFSLDSIDSVTVSGLSIDPNLATATVTIVGNQVAFDPGTDFDELDLGDTATVLVVYTMSDDSGASSSATLTICVTGQNDPPMAKPDKVTTTENAPVTVDVLANDTDLDGDDNPANFTLQMTDSIVVSGLSTGSRLITGSVNVVGNQVTFDPGTDFDELNSGDVATVLVVYTMNDDSGSSSTSTLTICVNGQNDPPDGADSTIMLLEDATHTFAPGNFGLSDPTDAPVPNNFLSVVISSLPSRGTLALNGNPVSVNDEIAVANLGQLVYRPALNENGASYARFGFRVRDNGGTADGGVDLDPVANTITFDVKPVNDAPAITLIGDQTVVVPGVTHTVSNFAFGFQPGGGADEANQLIDDFVVTNTNNGLFSIQPDIANNGTLTYTPVSSANSCADVTVRVRDNGGTANGGVDQSVAQTFEICVAKTTVEVRSPLLLKITDTFPGGKRDRLKLTIETDPVVGHKFVITDPNNVISNITDNKSATRVEVPLGSIERIEFELAGGSDRLIVDFSDAPPNFNLSVTIDGGAGHDTVTFAGNNSLGTGNVTIGVTDRVEDIFVNGPITTLGGPVTLNALQSLEVNAGIDVGAGAFDLTAGRDVFGDCSVGSLISGATGTISGITGIAGVRVAATSNVTMTSSQGGIAGCGTNTAVTAGTATLNAKTSIGSALVKLGQATDVVPLRTEIEHLSATADGIGIFIVNDGPLTIDQAEATNSNPPGGTPGFPFGIIEIASNRVLTVAANPAAPSACGTGVTICGTSVFLTATEVIGRFDNRIVIEPDARVATKGMKLPAFGGTVSLVAGDCVRVRAGAIVTAENSITITIDDADNAGAVVHNGKITPNPTINGSLKAACPLPPAANPNGEGSPWQNAANHMDVNDDGHVSALDALVAINFLNGGSRLLGEGESGSMAYVDVNGDWTASPLDVLMIVNYLNAQSTRHAEGESMDGGLGSAVNYHVEQLLGRDLSLASAAFGDPSQLRDEEGNAIARRSGESTAVPLLTSAAARPATLSQATLGDEEGSRDWESLLDEIAEDAAEAMQAKL